MIELTIRVPDDLAQTIGDLVKRIPGAEVLYSVEDLKTETLRDECAKETFNDLLGDKTIRRPGDFAWIMRAMEDGVIDDFSTFSSYQSFIDYLSDLKIEKLPSKTTLYNNCILVRGTFPEYVFSDKPDARESLRRKNVINRFLSSYRRAKRAKLNTERNSFA